MLTFRISLKYGLHANSTNLWAPNCFPSHENVISTKSDDSWIFLNSELTFILQTKSIRIIPTDVHDLFTNCTIIKTLNTQIKIQSRENNFSKILTENCSISDKRVHSKHFVANRSWFWRHKTPLKTKSLLLVVAHQLIAAGKNHFGYLNFQNWTFVTR